MLWNNRKSEPGPFDIIGDVHGCCDELEALLHQLGYANGDGSWAHPDGRKVVFVGDLVDRGPRIVDTLRTVMAMSQAGTALCVPGNHDITLKRKLEGRDVTVSHGLDRTLAELDQQPTEFRTAVQQFIDGLVSHYVFDEGRLVVAHAGMKAEMQGRGSAKVRDFALSGEKTGETDEFGLPVRYNWASEYRGGARVLARATYAEPARPFLAPSASWPLSAQQANDDLLDIDDVRGKRLVETRLHRHVTIREENAAAALEVMSRFAANPKWLIYLPPTMSPSETSKREGLLEHPAEAFS